MRDRRPIARRMRQENRKREKEGNPNFSETRSSRALEQYHLAPHTVLAWLWENMTGTHVDDRILELDMQPVVGDSDEGIGCPTQELHSFTLQHREGHLRRHRRTLSLELSHSSNPFPSP